MTTIEAIKAIAEAKFVPFDELDWNTFCGVDCESPLIHYAEKYVIIQEDEVFLIIATDDVGSTIKVRVKKVL